MRHEDRFVMSHRPYAVNMGSLRMEIGTGWKGDYASAQVGAVWFRRKNGVTAACVGELWDSQWAIPADAEQFLRQHEDGRYGGRCFARWDGTNFWCAEQDPVANAGYLELLRPMLENFPAVPPGYEGWWRF